MFGNTKYVNYLSYFTFAKFLRSVQMLRPMRSVLWGGITMAAIKYTRQISDKLDICVREIKLSSDGRHVDFIFQSGRQLLNLDISSI